MQYAHLRQNVPLSEQQTSGQAIILHRHSEGGDTILLLALNNYVSREAGELV